MHDVTTGNEFEVQIEGKRSADVLLSEINLIYVKYLDLCTMPRESIKSIDCHV